MKAPEIFDKLKGKADQEVIRVLMRMVEDHSTLKQVCADLQKQNMEVIGILRVVTSEMTSVAKQVEAVARAGGHSEASLQQFYSQDIDDVVGEDGKDIQ